MAQESRTPGDDHVVAGGDDTLLNITRSYRKEALDARRTRMQKNTQNRRAYLGIQDWSHKVAGQSKEFLPKTPVAVEQFVSFAKKAMTQFGAYYSVELGPDSKSPLSGEGVRRLMECHINNMLVEDNVEASFPVQMSNALKVGCLESLMIFKVHGNMVNTRRFDADDGELKPKVVKHWKLRIDVIRPEDYYPDPTGAGLYEIHSLKRDLSYLVDRADDGTYNKEVVNRIKEDYTREETEERKRRPHDQGQDFTIKPGFRKKVRIDECWGSIISNDGKTLHRNVFWAVANDKYIIREPTANPFWHQESPFVVVPLLKVPFSVWHKAIFDQAVQINFAMNEYYNLIMDGGLASVWGVKQLRVDDLEDPRDISDGIPQGETLKVKSTLPHGAKVLETITEGQVPGDAMAVFEMLSREFAASALSNELKLGALPSKQVLATEINEVSSSNATILDSMIADVERDGITKVFRKAWLTIMQNMDNILTDEVVSAIGVNGAFSLARMSPAERYAAYSTDCSFNVFGLSAVLARARDFQKFMALLQAVSSVPVLMQAFFQKYSPDKVLSAMMKMLNINPEQMARDEIELSTVNQELQGLQFFANLASGGGGTTQQGSGTSAQTTGESELPAEIASEGNPSSGLAGLGGN